jgi:hypothetical protein
LALQSFAALILSPFPSSLLRPPTQALVWEQVRQEEFLQPLLLEPELQDLQEEELLLD